ncbi:MAG: hypothetical protein ACREA9_23230 [Pyrinomonadaceae bacterium]
MRSLVLLVTILALSVAACQPAEAGWFPGKLLFRGGVRAGKFINNHRPHLLRKVFGRGC